MNVSISYSIFMALVPWLEAALGASQTSALGLAITEGRGATPKYGGCGDGVSWAYERAGSHNHNTLNRVSLNGSWAPGQNLVMLARAASLRTKADYVSPGDVLILTRPNGNHGDIFLCAVPALNKFYSEEEHMSGAVEAGSMTLRAMAQALDPSSPLALQRFAGMQVPADQLGSAPFLTWDFNSYGGVCRLNVRTETPLDWCPSDRVFGSILQRSPDDGILPPPAAYSAPDAPREEVAPYVHCSCLGQILFG
jgi:hypothetical protein